MSHLKAFNVVRVVLHAARRFFTCFHRFFYAGNFISRVKKKEGGNNITHDESEAALCNNNNTSFSKCAGLLEEVRSREDELVSLRKELTALREDVQFVREEKRQGETEHAALHAKAKALSDRLDSEKRELARLEESRAEASRLLQETIEEKERRISQCDAREVETTKIKVDMQATMREVISDKEKVRRDQIAIENERSRLSEATERLAKTSRRVEEEAADVTARLHREERQLVKQKTLLDEDMRRVSLAKDELLRVRDEQENKSRELNEKEARLFSMSTEADSVRVRLKEEEERIVTWRAELDEEKRRILSTQEVLTEIEERGIENSRRDE